MISIRPSFKLDSWKGKVSFGSPFSGAWTKKMVAVWLLVPGQTHPRKLWKREAIWLLQESAPSGFWGGLDERHRTGACAGT